jgi:hypothetical protein
MKQSKKALSYYIYVLKNRYEMSDNELQASIKILKEKLKDMRKKNKILRKENKLILEKVEKYPCCKHIDKRKFSNRL